MTPIEVLTIAGSIGGLASPFILLFINRSAQARRDSLENITKRLDHVDNCLDDLKLLVAGQNGLYASRKDMEDRIGYERSERHKLQSDMQAIILQLATTDELRAVDTRLGSEIRDLKIGLRQ